MAVHLRQLLSGYFFRQLLAATIVVLLPAMALLVYLQYGSLALALQTLQNTGLVEANEAARGTDRALSRINKAFEFLRSRDEVLSLNSPRCDTLLAGLYSTELLLRNIVVLDSQGKVACAANRHPLMAKNAKGMAWYEEALTKTGRHLGPPYVRKTDGAPGLTISEVLTDANGGHLGMIVAAIDVERFSASLLRPVDLPEGSVIAIINASGELLARSQDAKNVFGKRIELQPHDRVHLTEPVPVHRGVDGVLRVRTLVPLNTAPWTLYVGIPVERLQEQASRTIWVSAGALLLSVLACLAVAVYQARRLSAPTRELANAVKLLGQGNRSALVNPKLPGEFGDIAREFNSMVQALETLEKERIDSETLRAKNQAKDDFLAQMSHELRTPLNALLGFSSLLEESTAGMLDEAQAQQMALMIEAGKQLRELIEDVLDLTRIEARKLPLNMRDVDPRWVLQSVVHTSESQAASANVRVILEPFNGPVPLVHVDPLRLQQALSNLVSNAIKYNRFGGEVRLSMEVTASHVRLCVRDTGLGMSAKQLTEAFEPFNRLGQESSGIPGTGIGLPLTRQLMELMNGKVELVSAENLGTLATLTLALSPSPRHDSGRPVEGAATQDKPPLNSSDEPTKGTVLYIEDIPVNAELVRALLKRTAEVSLVVAEDGRSGLERAAALRPDLILLDMHLPDMHGTAVLSSLRANPLTQDIPVVAVSAGAMSGEIAKARAAGANDYLTKPLALEQFAETVRTWLGKRGIPREAPTSMPSA